MISNTYCCATYNRGFASLSSNSGSTGNYIGITLSDGSTAFGFDYFMVISGDLSGTIPGQGVVTVANVDYQIFGTLAPQKSFFGFVSPAPIVGNIRISGFTPSFGASAFTQVDVMNFSYDTSGQMQRNIGYFKPGDPSWALDFNGNGQFDASDRVFPFAGQPGAIAVTGDWNGDGRTKVGYYINGFWVLDYNGNGTYDGVQGGDKFYAFGGSGASYVPVVGDWNGDGKTKIGFYNNGFWALDVNGNGTFDGVVLDSFFGFGGNGVGEMPVLGDWNGNGRTKIG